MTPQAGGRPQDKLEIGVLYGFRALMVLFVCNYHIWQLGWLGQYVTLFGTKIDLDFWTRSSYVFVDGMLLMSGFLLYLPYARQQAYGTPVPGVRRFYWNRLVRIVPSYLASVLIVLFLVVLPGGEYQSAAARNKDILTHLTFTFTFFRETYLYTPINGVLWTIAIEMQFYLIFPLLAKGMRKRPAFTLCAMAAAGLLFRFVVRRAAGDLAIWINQMPAFLDVYAVGMLGAILYVRFRKRLEASGPKSALRGAAAFFSVVLFLAGCWLLTGIMHTQTENGLMGAEQLRLSQWSLRLPLAATMLLLMLSAAFMPRFLQKLLDNRLMRFLSAISMNLYIWHQLIGAQIAQNLFPATLHGDLQLQRAFTLMCYAVSILAAMAATYGLEKPAARRLNQIRRQLPAPKESNRR